MFTSLCWGQNTKWSNRSEMCQRTDENARISLLVIRTLRRKITWRGRRNKNQIIIIRRKQRSTGINRTKMVTGTIFRRRSTSSKMKKTNRVTTKVVLIYEITIGRRRGRQTDIGIMNDLTARASFKLIKYITSFCFRRLNKTLFPRVVVVIVNNRRYRTRFFFFFLFSFLY